MLLQDLFAVFPGIAFLAFIHEGLAGFESPCDRFAALLIQSYSFPFFRHLQPELLRLTVTKNESE
jgi:hypothetical protein